MINSIDGGFAEFWKTASEFGRTRVIDLSIQKDLEFTLWVALFAVPFQNLGIFGTDQLMAQRMFCCKNAHEASKAIIVSSAGQIVTITMPMGFSGMILAGVFAAAISSLDSILAALSQTTLSLIFTSPRSG